MNKSAFDIIERVDEAIHSAARPADSVTIIAAGKTMQAEKLLEVHRVGITHFGENYLQEALHKQQALHEHPLRWHFIGHIQSRKTKLIAQHFDYVHSIDRYKVAKMLSQHRGKERAPMNIMMQLNLDDESSKSGVDSQTAEQLCQQISELPNIQLRGFMLIPKARSEFDAQRAIFSRARQLMQAINQRYGYNMDSLSMGMSNDLEAAILEGATMVRIGTALFGRRK